VATHPFHSKGFGPFFRAFGKLAHVKWFGTPRHVRRLRDIPWQRNDVTSPAVLRRWEGQVPEHKSEDSGSKFERTWNEKTLETTPHAFIIA